MNSKLVFTFFVVSGLLPFGASAMELERKVIKIKIKQRIKKAREGELEALNQKGTNGYTILHYGALKNNISLVKKVLKAGAAVNCTNIKGITPLHIACGCDGDSGDIVQLLLDNNANKNCVDKDGNSPLHFALACGKYGVAVKLIKAGANVNLTNNCGSTPLHFAVAKNEVWPIQELVAAGAGIFCKDNDKRSPFDIATMFGNIMAENALLLARMEQDKSQWERAFNSLS